MKQDNSRNRAFRILSCLIFIISCVIAIIVFRLHFPPSLGGKYCVDVECSYAKSIESGIITDWHSSLFCWEGHVFRNMLQTFGLQLSGIDIISIFCFIGHIVSIILFTYFVWKTTRHGYRFALCIIPPFLAFIYLSLYTNAALDYFFSVMLYVSIFLLVLINKAKTKTAKLALLILFFICIVHLLNYRKNAFFTVTALLYFLAIQSDILIFKGSRIRTLIISLVGTLLLYIGINIEIKRIIPINQEHPVLPMMMSDIINTATLTNEPLPNDFPVIPWRNKVMGWKLGAYGGYATSDLNNFQESLEIAAADGNLDSYLAERASFASAIKSTYIQYWKKHPKEMAISRCYQTLQFFTAPSTFSIVRNYLLKIYPSLKGKLINENYYKTKLSHLYTLLIPVLFILFTNKHPQERNDFFCQFTEICCWASLSYMISFLCVTPTFDTRYWTFAFSSSFMIYPYIGIFLSKSIKTILIRNS